MKSETYCVSVSGVKWRQRSLVCEDELVFIYFMIHLTRQTFLKTKSILYFNLLNIVYVKCWDRLAVRKPEDYSLTSGTMVQMSNHTHKKKS